MSFTDAGVVLTSAEVENLALQALLAHGASEQQAGSMAAAVAAAEQDGMRSHGLFYLPTYCEHLRCGKVSGSAVPAAGSPVDAVVRVDAKSGFAHAAIDVGIPLLADAANAHGVAVLAVTNSYNCGALGYHTSRVATRGLVCLGFTNAPASIAPWGGKKAALGTNPWSLAVPGGADGIAFVIDQSASVVAKSEVMKRARAGEPIPEGWALDADGRPTTSGEAALKGTMVPAGGYKGVGSALLVELMAACLTGATPGIQASPFSGTQGGPPRTGQFFIAIDPRPTSAGDFSARLEVVLAAMKSDPGCRLPGERKRAARIKAARDGILVDRPLYERIVALATPVQ